MNQSISQQAKSLLLKHGFHLKKSLGQNLLIDPASLERIIEAAKITKEDTVLEIGTGTGILTKELAKKAGNVLSYEIDKRIFEAAKEYLAGIGNIELKNEDFLKAALTHFSPLPVKGEGLGVRVKVVANVPYYITTPIIEKIFGHKDLFSTVLFTVQREFAERMIAGPGTKDYGSFSVFVNYHTEPKILFHIPKSAFLPQPDVGSAVISLDTRQTPKVAVKDEEVFFKIVRTAFNQRRKTLKKALSAKFDPEIIDKALSKSGIDGKRRGETLSIEEFATLANEVR
jgi:16S rRNA (adenine1518-N6/adenine1519-N6)-dimethyltransferase